MVLKLNCFNVDESQFKDDLFVALCCKFKGQDTRQRNNSIKKIQLKKKNFKKNKNLRDIKIALEFKEFEHLIIKFNKI